MPSSVYNVCIACLLCCCWRWVWPWAVSAHNLLCGVPPVLRSECEVLLEGQGPWQLPSNPDTSSSNRGSGGSEEGHSSSSSSRSNNDDVQLVFTPGHTAGCVSLLYRPDQALFSGDHLAWSHRLQRLTIFRAYNWHSVAQQLDSAAALRQLDFLHLLPGHGRRADFVDGADRVRQLDAMLAAEGYSSQPVSSAEHPATREAGAD